MTDQKEELGKLYKLKEQLKNTYIITQNYEQKNRLSSYLKNIENAIKEIESGNWINPVKLNLISEQAIGIDDSDINDINKSDTSFNIEINEIIPNSRDSEMNTLYSYYTFFEDNILSALNQSFLKLDYNLGKKRDEMFSKNDIIHQLIQEYSEDMSILMKINKKEQIEIYKERLAHQKKFLFIKLSDFLREFLEFLNTAINDMDMGRSNIFNKNEKFLPKYMNNNKNSVFNNFTFKDIIKESKIFIESFIEVLRLPDFKRKKL